MEQIKILEQIKEIAVANKLISEHNAKWVKADTPTNTYLDSLDQIEMCMLLEREYGIIITKPNCNHINTFGDLVSLVQNKIPKKQF